MRGEMVLLGCEEIVIILPARDVTKGRYKPAPGWCQRASYLKLEPQPAELACRDLYLGRGCPNSLETRQNKSFIMSHGDNEALWG